MPAVELIQNSDLRNQTIALIRDFPDYFWEAPATSSSSFHNQFARGKYGLWIHVLMAATALDRVIDSYVEQEKLTPLDADYARSAVLLHDGRKYGKSWTEGDTAEQDHDMLMWAKLCNSEIPYQVADAVATHMGPWYDGPAPVNTLQQVVHQADMMASARHITPAVYNAPQELLEEHSNLPHCAPDDNEPQRANQVKENNRVGVTND